AAWAQLDLADVSGSIAKRRLLPERFDPRDQHFFLKSAHELAFDAPAEDGAHLDAAVVGTTSGQGVEPVASPVIASPLRFEVAYESGSGTVFLMHPGDGRIVRTDGSNWSMELPDS